MLAVIGVLGGGVAFLLFFSGLAMASAPTAAFIHKTMFIWVALMAGPFLAERLGTCARSRRWACCSAGQAVILPPLGITWGTGETLIALATLIWAVEVVLASGVLGRVRSPIVGVARLGIGLVVLCRVPAGDRPDRRHRGPRTTRLDVGRGDRRTAGRLRRHLDGGASPGARDRSDVDPGRRRR